MAFVFSEGIRAANPHLNLVSATPVTAGCRMIKDAHEIDCMRLACRATLLVYRAGAQSLTPGMTTPDVRALVAAAYHRVGFEGEASLNVDEFTAVPHGSAKPQTLREGSILMLDDGCSVEGWAPRTSRAPSRPGQADRQDEIRLRPCTASAIRSAGCCAAGRAGGRRGRRSA